MVVATGYPGWRRAANALPAAIRVAGPGCSRRPSSSVPRAGHGGRFFCGSRCDSCFWLEVSWQPLFPWNAWTQWATKARVWFELGRVVPFAGSADWLVADGSAYFDAGPQLPPTLPLLQVWASIALGGWDDALMNWPWWQFAVALSFAVYGAMRALDMPALSALVVTFFVSSLPLANVHVALAGYADLPLAAYYACAALAFLRFAASRDLRDVLLAVVLALACTQIKAPGIGWAATLFRVSSPRYGHRAA